MSIDRLERRLPEVLTELSLPRTPDYMDTLLQRTERTPQRPAWSFLERWFPVSTLTASMSPPRRLPMRPLILLAVLVAVALASLVWYAGTQKKLPPLFGPARNGLIVTNTAAGEIITIDPATGARTTLVSGKDLCCASITPDGQHIEYLRIPSGSENPTGLVIAKLDGTTVTELPAESLRGLSWSDTSPVGDRDVHTTSAGLVIFDFKTQKLTPISVPFRVERAQWIGTTGDLLLSEDTPGPIENSHTYRIYRLAAGFTGAPTHLADLVTAVEPPAMSPDGTKFAYFIWGSEDRLHGRVHVFDLATGVDSAITPEDAASNVPIHLVEGVNWSPDSTSIASVWFFEGYDQIGITPVTGGAPTFVGPKEPQGFGSGFRMQFSPDGKSLLLRYGSDGKVRRVPVTGGDGEVVPWTIDQEWGWQRLAP